MVNLYVSRILREAGNEIAFTADNVPHLWKDNVIAELKRRGYDKNGLPLPIEDPEEVTESNE